LKILNSLKICNIHWWLQCCGFFSYKMDLFHTPLQLIISVVNALSIYKCTLQYGWPKLYAGYNCFPLTARIHIVRQLPQCSVTFWFSVLSTCSMLSAVNWLYDTSSRYLCTFLTFHIFICSPTCPKILWDLSTTSQKVTWKKSRAYMMDTHGLAVVTRRLAPSVKVGGRNFCFMCISFVAQPKALMVNTWNIVKFLVR
jgi:hypothetical protein